MDKMEKISEKLLDLGYKKQKFNKPSADEFAKGGNGKDFIKRLAEELGSWERASNFMESYHETILNDFIPEINFEGSGFEINFFTSKGSVQFEALGSKRHVNDTCGIVAQEVVPYKEMSIDGFYSLLVEKNLGIDLIAGSGDN